MQNNMDGNKVIFLLTILFGTQSFVLYSMEQQKKMVKVYSHGFGETGGADGPTYPDAPARIGQAVFYTQPAVLCLAEHISFRVNVEGYDSVHLLGRSCGAGIAIVFLLQLLRYDAAYFEGTSIQSKQDAQKILDAINNGALELTVPFLRAYPKNPDILKS